MPDVSQMPSWERWYQTAIAAGIDPLIFSGGLAGYFLFRWGMNLDKWKAIIIVWLVNILGQIRIAHSIKTDWDDILYYATIQAFLAFGAYSFLEGVKAMDLITGIVRGFIMKFAKERGVSNEGK